MGTPEFAVASLNALLQNKFNVIAVVTSPDKPAGRGQQLHQSAVKKYALEQGLRVLQPVNLKDAAFTDELRALKADLQIVVAFRMLPESVWNMPACGTYNLHASLLPKYRGAAPINWAIINGEIESGVTTFKLQHEIDTGNVLYREKTSITDTMTAGELHDRLMEIGSNLIVKTAKSIQESLGGKKLQFIKQEDSLATHAPKLSKETGRLNWQLQGRVLYNLIRGLSPYPAAHTQIKNGDSPLQMLKLFFAEFEIKAHSHTNGLLITDGKTFLSVACGGGLMKITELQLEGKKRMPVSEFLRGYVVKPGAIVV